jgi:uncharacterized membrane protein YjgN (DUF898 family)
MGIGSQDETAFAFDGELRDFVPIAVTNLVLTLVTLGVYRFWATTRERRYFWSNTRFIDDRLEWTGTGLELFLGFLIVLVLFFLPLVAIQLVAQALILQGYGGAAALLFIGFYVVFLGLAGFAIFRGLRYRLSRTEWHGIRGGTDESGLHYAWSYAWKTILSFMAMGLLLPWSMTRLWAERWNRMSFGPHNFVSAPEWSSLMGRFVVAYLAPFILLFGAIFVAAGAVVGATAGGSEDMAAGAAIIAGIAILSVYIIWPLVAQFFYSAYMREVIGSLSLSTLTFAFTARTKQWVWLILGNIGLWLLAIAVALVPIIALGLFQSFEALEPGQDPVAQNPVGFAALMVAFIVPLAIVGPFIRYRNWRFFLRHLEAGGEINLTQLTQTTTRELKQGEGLLDAFDMGAV